MIGVIESGNSGAVHRALRHLGYESEPYVQTGRYDALVLPGIGHYAAFMRGIDAEALRWWITGGGKTLAICVGMQALYERSAESDVPGLGLIPAAVTRVEGRAPRIGWRYVPQFEDWFYFVHSYTSGVDFVRYKSTLGVQFHPEKSGRAGLALLRGFFG